MSKQFETVKEKFNERWADFTKGYKDLLEKMENPNHVVHGEITISQVHRAVITNKYIFENYDNKASKIIEAACGNGFNTCYLITKGCDVKGFDISENAIEQANGLAKSLGITKNVFEVADQTYLGSIKDDSTDVVIALGLMRYLESDARDYIYRHVYRVLKKGGCFIVTNDNFLFELFALNDGTIKFWSKVIEEFSNAKKLLGGKSIGDALEEKVKLPKRQYAQHSVSQHIQRHAENPLTYCNVMKKYGFRLAKNSYPDCHMLPPLFEKSVDIEELDKIKAEVCLVKSEGDWRAMFMDDEFLSFLIKD